MSNRSGTQYVSAEATDPGVLALCRGYNDVRQELAPRADYRDLPNQHIAEDYERGRLLAANIRKAGFPLLEWPMGQAVPQAIQDYNYRAAQAIGNPLPPTRST